MRVMELKGGGLFLCLVVLFISSSMPAANTKSVATPSTSHHASSFNRTSFPSGFLFGTASSAYQYEGAANEGGKGPSVWDTYTRAHPERIKGRGNGNVAVDSYHRYKEDVRIMKAMGLDAYRFSISWARVLPHGKLSKGVNREGIQYYNNLINELLSKGLQPFITLFHWDLPQALEDEYGGFLSPRIVNDYKDYTELCYKEFGDRVKNWITFNEPWSYTVSGYVVGMFPPLRCSVSDNLNCTGGDSGREPYLVAHHLLLAHAASYNLYKQKYKASQKGKIGITLVSIWTVPLSNDRHDIEAAFRALDFMFGWFMDPLTYGTYPNTMISIIGNRLPKFTKGQSMMVKGSFDFIGINYYSAIYIANLPFVLNINPSYLTDARVIITTSRNGIPIGPLEAGSDLIAVYPRGFRDLLIYTKRKYNNPIIYITENGIAEINNSSLSLKEALEDHIRVDFYIQHLLYLQRAIKQGVRVRGYFAWSLLDNFEWNLGYSVRFGLNYVDFKDGLKRYPKLSAIWFKKFLEK